MGRFKVSNTDSGCKELAFFIYFTIAITPDVGNEITCRGEFLFLLNRSSNLKRHEESKNQTN